MRIPAQASALADLEVFVGLAERADPGGVARLCADGTVLAVLVCPLRGAGEPTAIGVRALHLDEPLVLDTTLDLAGLRAVLAAQRLPVSGPAPVRPPAPASAAAWAGIAPTRHGWTPVADPQALEPDLLQATLVAAGLLRLLPQDDAGQDVGQDAAPPVPGRRYGRSGPWIRLATARGDVVARRPPSLMVSGRSRPAPPVASPHQ